MYHVLFHYSGSGVCRSKKQTQTYTTVQQMYVLRVWSLCKYYEHAICVFGKFIDVTVPSTQVTSDGNQGYFSEENIYWAPASNITDLYEQLAHHKYREIPRHQIK